ncbi:hypothetical protein SB725_33590, partial [Pseudomonas sp. SIMBA_041]|uniref:hypothetical protein n=1 Tax=Pseudomonas sp. SIMBA_041 TaxID=3085782 RepID=UPI0039789033
KTTGRILEVPVGPELVGRVQVYWQQRVQGREILVHKRLIDATTNQFCNVRVNGLAGVAPVTEDTRTPLG